MTQIYPDCHRVYDAFSHAAASWPDRPILNTLAETAGIYGIDAGTLSYRDAKAEVDRLAAGYKAAGYPAGSRVMLLMENRPAFFLHWLALNGLDIGVVPVNPDLRAAELDYMIGHAEPQLAVAIESRVNDLAAAATSAGSTMAVIAVGADIPAYTGGAVTAPNADPAKREAAMLYTSGTTGLPKGCILSNSYFTMAGRWYAETGGLCALNMDGERMITPLPIFHMNAMAYSFMAMIAVGGCLTALDRFHPRTWWDSVRASQATCLHYLGVMPAMLMGMDAQDGDADNDVRFGFGAGVDPELHEGFEQRFGFPIVEAWAMTETGAGAVIVANREPRKIGRSVLGKAEGGVDMRIIDDEGKDIAGTEPGELLVRHKGDDPRLGFFSEYHKNPEETAKSWQGGWFHTGDIVRRDDDGDILFVDRKKNVIRRSGENVAAIEVESALMRHPAITSAAVAGIADPVRQEEIFACIVTENPSAELATEITTWCLGQLAYYKAPGYIAFVDALPLTSTNKLQRGVLKTMVQDLANDAGTHDLTALKKRQKA